MLDLKEERVVITGGNGFLGRHLQRVLQQRGVPSENIHVPLSANYDLTQQENAARMYDDMNPTVVIHLAAEVGGIQANRENPGRFFFANLAMGLHLIEEARGRRVKKFVQAGTICSYPKFTPVPFQEEDLWNGYPEETNAPYGIAKKSLLVMLQSYRQQYGLNGIYLLPVNLYGPGDNFDPTTSHVIPALIRKCVRAVETNAPSVEIWGTGSVSREFLHVADCARAIAMATETYDGPDPVNLGAGFEITIKALAEKIKGLTGFTGDLVWDTSKPDGQPRRCLDVSKARDYFDFSARVPLDKGLHETIQWYLENKDA